MVAGHFATALVAKQQAPAGPLAFYLVISQLPDLLWQLFHFIGIEPTLPLNPMATSLNNMQVHMTFSHDLLPTVGWFVVAVLAGRALFGRWRSGWIAGALVVVHLLCDAVSGHTHHVFGPDSTPIGLGLYASAPYVALGIEAVFTLGVMLWVMWTDAKNSVRRSRATLAVWAVVFAGGMVMLTLSAKVTVEQMTGLAPIEALNGTLVPGLIAMYASMFIALVWAESRPATRIDEDGTRVTSE
ncbi:MAG: hypothetical protein AB8H79_16830 [Myxococcota bacterium]